MLGIEPTEQRPMMDESLDVIMRLLTDPTPLTYDGEWFKLRDATLQLRPYTPAAPAASPSPAWSRRPGRQRPGGTAPAILSLAAIGGLRGPVDLKKHVGHRRGRGREARQDDAPRGLAAGRAGPPGRDAASRRSRTSARARRPRRSTTWR